jgi:hypothetical protein
MSTLSNQVRNSASLLDALDAVRNLRALSMLVIAFVGAALLIGLAGGVGVRSGSFGMGALGVLIGAFIAFVGINAAGIALMDESRAYTGRSYADAWVAAVFAALKFIVVALAIAAGLLLLVLFFALVFWICKIPYLGTLLFAFALPAAILVMGVAFFGSFAATFPVALPALWAGDGIAAALARVAGVVRTRLPNLLILLFLLMLLVGFVGFVVFSVLAWGWVTAGSLAASVTGAFGDLGALIGMGSTRPMGGGGGGTAVAGLIGGGIATAVALVLPALVQIKGFGLIYLVVAHDLDTTAMEAQMRERLAQVKQKADATRERVQNHNAAARQTPPVPPAGGTPPGGQPR